MSLVSSCVTNPLESARTLHGRSRVAFARNDLLFTMSDNTHARQLCSQRRERIHFHGRASHSVDLRPDAGLPTEAPKARRLVEPDGIEPTTSCLQSRRSPN